MIEQTTFPYTQPLSPASYVTALEPITPPPLPTMEQKTYSVLENNLPITPMTPPPAGPTKIESIAEQSKPRIVEFRYPSAIQKAKPSNKRSRSTLSCTVESTSSSSSSSSSSSNTANSSTSSSSESSPPKQLMNTKTPSPLPVVAATRKHTCKTCGKSFTRRDNLMAHQRVHTDERPYKCHLCPKRFRWMSAMRHHQDMHRRREKKRLLQQQQEKREEMKIVKTEPDVLPTELIIPESVPGPQIDEFSEFAHLPADFFDIGLGNQGQDISYSPTTVTPNEKDNPATSRLVKQMPY